MGTMEPNKKRQLRVYVTTAIMTVILTVILILTGQYFVDNGNDPLITIIVLSLIYFVCLAIFVVIIKWKYPDVYSALEPNKEDIKKK